MKTDAPRDARPASSLILAGLTLILLSTSDGCYSKPTSMRPSLFAYSSDASKLMKAISQNTITFGGVSRSSAEGYAKPSGGRGAASDFPLQVSATIVTDDVIEAASRYFRAALGKKPAYAAQFAARYRALFNLDDNFIIWISLKTQYAEEYLKPERWVIFVEDEDGNQYEPSEIVEDIPAGAYEENSNRPFHGRQPDRTGQFGLLFPKQTAGGGTILPSGRNLRITFMNPTKHTERASGEWKL